MAIKKPKRINKNFLNTKRMGKVLGVVIHNDYGSQNATAEWYINSFLPGRANNNQLSLGIAHYYIDKNVIARAVDTYRVAWHLGNKKANEGGYIGYETVGSRWDNGLSTAEFKLNEDMVLRQAAEDLLFYGLPVNRQTVRLHQEFSATSCPHRSWDLHGKSVNAVKDYFISRIKYYQSLGKTVDEMIDAENQNGRKSTPPKKTPAQSQGETKRYLELPADVKTWNIYDKNGPYTVGNEIHKLTPSAFGGLTYEIKGDVMKDVYLIETGVKGLVAIYAGPDTSAKVRTEKPKSQPQTYENQDGSLYKVQVGAYANKENAEAKAEQLEKEGHDTYITKQ